MSDSHATNNLPKNLEIISGDVPPAMQEIVNDAVRKGFSAVLFAKDTDGTFKTAESRGLDCIKTPAAKEIPLEDILNTHLDNATMSALGFASRHPDTEFVLLDNTPRVCAKTNSKGKESARR